MKHPVICLGGKGPRVQIPASRLSKKAHLPKGGWLFVFTLGRKSLLSRSRGKIKRRIERSEIRIFCSVRSPKRDRANEESAIPIPR